MPSQNASNKAHNSIGKSSTKKREWLSFLFITLLFFPITTFLGIGVYGFIIWFSQMFIFGPPGVS